MLLAHIAVFYKQGKHCTLWPICAACVKATYLASEAFLECTIIVKRNSCNSVSLRSLAQFLDWNIDIWWRCRQGNHVGGADKLQGKGKARAGGCSRVFRLSAWLSTWRAHRSEIGLLSTAQSSRCSPFVKTIGIMKCRYTRIFVRVWYTDGGRLCQVQIPISEGWFSPEAAFSKPIFIALRIYFCAVAEQKPAVDEGDGWIKQKKGNKKALTQETGVKVSSPRDPAPHSPFPPHLTLKGRFHWMHISQSLCLHRTLLSCQMTVVPITVVRRSVCEGRKTFLMWIWG